jgi:hypothetical protein
LNLRLCSHITLPLILIFISTSFRNIAEFPLLHVRDWYERTNQDDAVFRTFKQLHRNDAFEMKSGTCRTKRK